MCSWNIGCLKPMGGDTDMKGWLIYLHECVFIFHMKKAKGGFPLHKFLCFPGVSGEKEVGEDHGMTMTVFFLSSPHHKFSFPY